MDQQVGFIYTLSDPRTGEVRYIGQTIRKLKRRLDSHIADAKKSTSTHKAAWIRGLLNIGMRPIIEEIETVSRSDMDYWEEYYIRQFLCWGFNLTNTTIEVVSCKPSDSTRLEQSNAKKKAWEDPEYKAEQIRRMQEGKDANRDEISRISREVAYTYLQTPECQKKRTEGIRRAHKSEAYRQKRSEILKRWWSTASEDHRESVRKRFEESKEARAASFRKTSQTPEYRAQMTIVNRKRLARSFIGYKDGLEIGRWDNIIVCAKELGLYEQGISGVLHGKNKTTKGYTFKFLDQLDVEQKDGKL